MSCVWFCANIQNRTGPIEILRTLRWGCYMFTRHIWTTSFPLTYTWILRLSLSAADSVTQSQKDKTLVKLRNDFCFLKFWCKKVVDLRNREIKETILLKRHCRFFSQHPLPALCMLNLPSHSQLCDEFLLLLDQRNLKVLNF